MISSGWSSSPPQLTRANLSRVNVVGVSGSGKSTLARDLQSRLGTRLIEMDRLYWGPDWTEPSDDQFRSKVSGALADTDEWILDGNYHSKTRDIKWQRATAIIWMDMPFGTTIYRAMSRAVRRAWVGDELWPGTGNRESFRRSFFSRESIILWTLTSYHRVRRRYHALSQDAALSHICWIHLRSARGVNDFLREVDSL